MDAQEILKALEHNDGTFPREALEAAIARRDEIIPQLLSIVQQAEKKAQDLLKEEAYMAHLYAMYLLAQFRETRAYPLIVKFFSLPGELSLDLTGDVVTEDLDRILASVSGGDISLMMSLAENEEANQYVRNAALRGMLVLAACGEKSREEVVATYKSFFLKLKREPSQIWNGLVRCCSDLYPEEVVQQIKQVYEEELADPFVTGGLDDVDRYLALGKENVLNRLRTQYRLIDDTIAELEWWACFDQPSWKRRSKSQSRLAWGSLSGVFEVPKSHLAKPKVKRNAPCPCGSGKKYKKCCGR